MDEFITFIRSRDPQHRPANLKRSFQGQVENNGKSFVSIAPVLKFCFNHQEYKSCNIVCDIVQSELLNTEPTCVQTTYELYKLIAKIKILKNEYILENIGFNEDSIQTLLIDHKNSFF